MSPVTLRLVGAVVFSVVATAGAVLALTIPARAQANRIVVCRAFSGGSSPESWMNSQLSGGKTNFVQAGSQLCAW